MAATPWIGSRLTSITHAATPLPGEVIPGSAQEYEISGSFPKSRSPVFFAPQHDTGAFWETLMELPNRIRYSYAALSNRPVAYPLVGSLGSFEWERLGFELMRIASLERNWDGEGAEAVPQTTVTTAAILLALAKSAMAQFAYLPASFPTIFPTVEGAVTLKWALGERELKCTVLGDMVEVVRWGSPDRYESDGLWEVSVQGVGEHFAWLLQH